jgi:hypothetical protein
MEAYNRAKQYEEEINELLNDENFPQDLKGEIIKLRNDSDKEHERFMEANKGKKIVGYNEETFMPIFEK